jgi:hypothetical protein
VRSEERRLILLGAAALALAAALAIPALYQLGLWIAPARPDAAAMRPTTPLMRAAIWARAEAALLAVIIEDRRQDPWCNPAGALDARNRVLQRMLANGAIDEPTLARAVQAPLSILSAPPTPCS